MRQRKFWLWFTCVVAAALGIALIFKHPNPILWDQGFVQSRLSWISYPSLKHHVTSVLLASIFNGIAQPSPEYLNEAIRSFALVFYVGSSFWLATRWLKSSWALIAFLMLLFTSRYPFLWLSSELFTGAFLALTLGVLIEPNPECKPRPCLSGIFLAAFAFAKKDALFAAIVLAFVAIPLFREVRQKARFAGAFLLTALLINLPGIAEHGLRGQFADTDGYFAIGQHYAALFERHQLIRPTSNPWESWEGYMRASFPGAGTVPDIIIHHTASYFDFVALSFVEGIRRIFAAFGWLLALVALRVWFWKKSKMAVADFERLTLVAFLGLIPMVLLAYPHIRYLARYYPLVAVASLTFVEASADKRAFALLLISLVSQAKIFFNDISNLKQMQQFWFSD